MIKRRGFSLVALAGCIGVALAQVQDSDSTQAPQADSAADSKSGDSPTATTVIDDLSQEEIDAELARADEILEDPDEVKEFTDTNPLPADLPLALPSDF